MKTPHILIADDDQSLRTVIAETFRIAGYEVSVAGDGAEALSLCLETEPQALVMDVGMPKMNGIAVCRELRAHPAGRDLPIVLLTARAAEADRHWGLDAGADEYLTKPFDPETLIGTVNGLLEAQRRGEERNPLTKLPDLAPAARRAAEEATHRGHTASAVVLELEADAAAIYRQKYGDLALAKAIVTAADCLREAAEEAGAGGGGGARGAKADATGAAGGGGGTGGASGAKRISITLGHAGDVSYSRFLLAGQRAAVEAAATRGRQAFARRVPEMYDAVDQRRGHVLLRAADGSAREVPFLALHAESAPIAQFLSEPLTTESERLAA